MRVATKLISGLVLGCAILAGVAANEVVGRTPLQLESFGQQSDANSAPYNQAFVAPASAILESIRWWGFHGLDSMGPSFDSFVVSLDGVVQTGTLTVTNLSPFFNEYTLDVADAMLSSSELTIVNDSFDVEWYWQSASAVGNDGAPDATAVAFSLIGRIGVLPPGGQPVPEPTSLSLALLALGFGAIGMARSKRT